MILPRQSGYGNCYYSFGSLVCNNNSAWSRWGRWVLLACIVIGVLFLFFLFSCLSARRRRRAGISPYRGTAWAIGRPPPGHGQANYTSQPYYGQTQQQQQPQSQPYYNNSNNPPPPPAYSPPPNTYYGNSPGIELQQPNATYQGGYRSGEQYAPPKDPPPRV